MPVIVPFEATGVHRLAVQRVLVNALDYSPSAALSHLDKQARQPDFFGFVALEDTRVLGMGFGCQALPGQWWFDRLLERVQPDEPAVQNAWCLVELGVLTPYQGQRIGGALHDRLLTTQPHANVLLSAYQHNTRARRMYERRGWQYLLKDVQFVPGATPAVIMHQTLKK